MAKPLWMEEDFDKFKKQFLKDIHDGFDAYLKATTRKEEQTGFKCLGVVEMENPSWKDAPEWAEYRAMDGNGVWWWYEKKPAFDGRIWIRNDGKHKTVFNDDKFRARNSLEKRPAKCQN